MIRRILKEGVVLFETPRLRGLELPLVLVMQQALTICIQPPARPYAFEVLHPTLVASDRKKKTLCPKPCTKGK